MNSTTVRSVLFAALILLLAGMTGFSQEAEVVYVDFPEVEIRRPGGVTILADFGDSLSAGDSVVTTRFGEAELELASGGGTVSISRDTVYTLREVPGSDGGESRSVMNVALGSVRFKFNRIAGRGEPVIGSPTSVAGVRGTAFTTYVASDGSTVFVVEEGQVDVSAEGRTVQLVTGQGVEVLPGDEPGEPFDAIDRAFDFSAYNEERINAFLLDPERAVRGHTRRLREFSEQIGVIVPLYEESRAALEAANERVRTLEGDARTEFFEKELVPIRARTADLFDTMRFYALSGLSLRRYVLGRMYLLVTIEYANAPEDPTYLGFIDAYNEALGVYESGIVPVLDPSDL